MENSIQIFNFKGNDVRVVAKDGQPWWVTKDVCVVLDIQNYRDAISDLDDDEKGVAIADTPGGKQEVLIVTEPGLYSLIFRSRKPEAREFKRWVTHDVLPALRKDGGYVAVDAGDTDEAVIARGLLAAQRSIERLKAKTAQLANRVNEMRPKEIFADAVATSHTEILIGDLAKLLRQNKIEIGQKRLFEWLRDNGYLIRQQGSSWNMPTQKSMELGLFRVKETAITKPDGSTLITRTVKVTGKGQVYFTDKFLGKKVA